MENVLTIWSLSVITYCAVGIIVKLINVFTVFKPTFEMNKILETIADGNKSFEDILNNVDSLHLHKIEIKYLITTLIENGYLKKQENIITNSYGEYVFRYDSITLTRFAAKYLIEANYFNDNKTSYFLAASSVYMQSVLEERKRKEREKGANNGYKYFAISVITVILCILTII